MMAAVCSKLQMGSSLPISSVISYRKDYFSLCKTAKNLTGSVFAAADVDLCSVPQTNLKSNPAALIWYRRRYSRGDCHNGYHCIWRHSERKKTLLEQKWATVQATCTHLSGAGTVKLSSNPSGGAAPDSAHIYQAAEISGSWCNRAADIQYSANSNADGLS